MYIKDFQFINKLKHSHTQIPTLNKQCNQSLLKALQKKIDQQITNKQINIQV